MRICPTCHLEYHDDRASCLLDGAALEEVADERIGRMVGGRYLIEAVLGEGGMGTVYRARSTLVDEPVAVKILHKHLAGDETLKERFRREARAAAAIAHENVVEIKDFGVTEDHSVYIAMEMLDGETLRQAIERGPMPAKEVVDLGAQMARGIARAHDLGIVHRDLKPENVFLVPRGGRTVAKIVDFGIARSRDESHLTMRGAVIGTPQYLAPERVKMNETPPSADLYSLGVMLWEMLTGKLPFESSDVPGFILAHLETPAPRVASVQPSVPKALDALIDRMLAKDPIDRPVDAHQLLRELEELGKSLGAPPTTTGEIPLVVRARPSLLAPVTQERWERRVLAFEQVLRRGFPETRPPEAAIEAMQAVREGVAQLEFLRRGRLSRQHTLEKVAAESREGREQLGRAVHALGRDLSEAREAVRRLRASLAEHEAQEKDLEFQLSVLREKLEAAERKGDADRAQAEQGLGESAQQLEKIRDDMGAAAKDFVRALGDRADLRQLVAELGAEG